MLVCYTVSWIFWLWYHRRETVKLSLSTMILRVLTKINNDVWSCWLLSWIQWPWLDWEDRKFITYKQLLQHLFILFCDCIFNVAKPDALAKIAFPWWLSRVTCHGWVSAKAIINAHTWRLPNVQFNQFIVIQYLMSFIMINATQISIQT